MYYNIEYALVNYTLGLKTHYPGYFNIVLTIKISYFISLTQPLIDWCNFRIFAAIHFFNCSIIYFAIHLFSVPFYKYSSWVNGRWCNGAFFRLCTKRPSIKSVRRPPKGKCEKFGHIQRWKARGSHDIQNWDNGKLNYTMISHLWDICSVNTNCHKASGPICPAFVLFVHKSTESDKKLKFQHFQRKFLPWR